MIHHRLRFFVLIVVLFVCTACSLRTPIPFGVVPTAREVTQEDEEYGQQVLATLSAAAPLSNDYAKNARIRKIVSRLSDATGAVTHPWRVFVLQDPKMKNAAATRGNYIFIWDGMLDAVHSDDELASVLGHEMAHVLAGHVFPTPGETSAAMLGTIGDLATRGAITSTTGTVGLAADLAGALVHTAVDAFVLNPEKQRVELEADQIGLFLMADAGYSPEAAERFWERNANDPAFAGLGWAQFMSSHPTSLARLSEIRATLPAALERYRSRNQKESWSLGSSRHTLDSKSSANTPPQDERPATAISNPYPPGNQRWEVRREILAVYSQPSQTGEVVAELAAGRVIEGRAINENWVELSRPFRGFVQTSQIELKSSHEAADQPRHALIGPLSN